MSAISILIDAENVQVSHADGIFTYANELGDVVSKEIYGTATALTTWVAPVLKYAIHTNLTLKAVKGKNSSDIALVIGAMDQLLAGESDTFIIASSDSDFSALSVRLRSAGKTVIGMGTDKSNELWRAACSSFVVLEPVRLQAIAAPVKAASSAAPAPRRGDKAYTHEDRVAAIRRFILKRLNSNNGRVQVSTLFPGLNRMAEYRADRQEAGVKPLNYLTHTFGQEFVFENTPDGNSWISLPGAEPLSRQVAEAAETEEASEREETVESEAQAMDEPAEEIETEAQEEPAPAEEAPDTRAALVSAGIPEEAVDQVVAIFEGSDSPRAAYNKLRSAFGNATGRDYYNTVKALAEQG